MPINNEWAAKVIKCMQDDEERCGLYQDAIDFTKEETGEDPPEGAGELLAWLRGDEPEDAQDDPAEEYADFLLTEWDLYGPEGE